MGSICGVPAPVVPAPVKEKEGDGGGKGSESSGKGEKGLNISTQPDGGDSKMSSGEKGRRESLPRSPTHVGGARTPERSQGRRRTRASTRDLLGLRDGPLSFVSGGPFVPGDVAAALKETGLEDVNLMFAIDATSSNAFNGKVSFGRHSLHSRRRSPNPYEVVLESAVGAFSAILGEPSRSPSNHSSSIKSSGRTPRVSARSSARSPPLSGSDDKRLSMMDGVTMGGLLNDSKPIRAFLFGSRAADSNALVSLKNLDGAVEDKEDLIACYRTSLGRTVLGSVTSYAPAISQAASYAAATGRFHCLIIITDGVVTTPTTPPTTETKSSSSSTEKKRALWTASSGKEATRARKERYRRLSREQFATLEAIDIAASTPLGILVVGVGDGPWDGVRDFLTLLSPYRPFENFNFLLLEEDGRLGDGRERSKLFHARVGLRLARAIVPMYVKAKQHNLIGSSFPLQLTTSPSLFPPPRVIGLIHLSDESYARKRRQRQKLARRLKREAEDQKQRRRRTIATTSSGSSGDKRKLANDLLNEYTRKHHARPDERDRKAQRIAEEKASKEAIANAVKGQVVMQRAPLPAREMARRSASMRHLRGIARDLDTSDTDEGSMAEYERRAPRRGSDSDHSSVKRRSSHARRSRPRSSTEAEEEDDGDDDDDEDDDEDDEDDEEEEGAEGKGGGGGSGRRRRDMRAPAPMLSKDKWGSQRILGAGSPRVEPSPLAPVPKVERMRGMPTGHRRSKSMRSISLRSLGEERDGVSPESRPLSPPVEGVEADSGSFGTSELNAQIVDDVSFPDTDTGSSASRHGKKSRRDHPPPPPPRKTKEKGEKRGRSESGGGRVAHGLSRHATAPMAPNMMPRSVAEPWARAAHSRPRGVLDYADSKSSKRADKTVLSPTLGPGQFPPARGGVASVPALPTLPSAMLAPVPAPMTPKEAVRRMMSGAVSSAHQSPGFHSSNDTVPPSSRTQYTRSQSLYVRTSTATAIASTVTEHEDSDSSTREDHSTEFATTPGGQLAPRLPTTPVFREDEDATTEPGRGAASNTVVTEDDVDTDDDDDEEEEDRERREVRRLGGGGEGSGGDGEEDEEEDEEEDGDEYREPPHRRGSDLSSSESDDIVAHGRFLAAHRRQHPSSSDESIVDAMRTESGGMSPEEVMKVVKQLAHETAASRYRPPAIPPAMPPTILPAVRELSSALTDSRRTLEEPGRLSRDLSGMSHD